jgi:TniQ
VTGESLDSWLEAIARRHQCRFGDLLTATVIQAHPRRSDWLVALSPDQRCALAAATGVIEDVLTTMTLEHYHGRALHVDPNNRTLRRSFPCGWRTGSRYCPHCLAGSGGRWQLAWRLNWTFACIRHNCLLADSCPQCGARQRHRPHNATSIPEPGSCPRFRVAPNSRGHRCGAALSMADVLTVPDGHPALVTQRCINTILAGRVSALPIYKNGEHASREVLADIQALARWIITAVDHEGLGHHLPGDMLSALKAHRKVLDWPYGMYWNSVAVVPNVIDAAVGITVATSILGQSTNSIAAVAFRRLMTHAAKRRPCSLPISNRNISRVLTLIQSAALRTTTPQ